MRQIILSASVTILLCAPTLTLADGNSAVTGAAGGAVTGAVVGGPVGAAVGGAAGAVIGGAAGNQPNTVVVQPNADCQTTTVQKENAAGSTTTQRTNCP